MTPINAATPKTVASHFIKSLFGPVSTGPIYICSFPNERLGEPGERHVATRIPGDIEKFAKKWDQPERGLFFCVGTVAPGKRRAKENIVETICLHSDLDFKNVDIDRAEIEKRLSYLPMLPSIIVFSGGGLHLYWIFNEAIRTQETPGLTVDPVTGEVTGTATGPCNIERIEMALRQITDLVGGDLSCCEVSRVLRLPGTHNTKQGAWTEVEVIVNNGLRYELDEIEDYLAEASPIILRKDRVQAVTAGQDDFFARYAKDHHFKPSIDVDKRLDAMMYMGGGDAAVHQTQVEVSASLLSSGYEVAEVVEHILAATRGAAGDYGKRWNWAKERRNIEKMCDTWLSKHPEIRTKIAKNNHNSDQPKLTVLAGGKPASPAIAKLFDATSELGNPRDEQQHQSAAASGTTGATPSNVTPIKPPTPPKVSLKKEEQHVKLGEAVIAQMKDVGDDFVITKNGNWHYHGGIWEQIDQKWHDVQIEIACRGMNYKSKMKLIAETRSWMLRHPGLWHDEIKWDQHGKIPTRSGLVDPITREVTPAKADDFCSWRIETEYDPTATCPWWETMIGDTFSDREPAVAAEHIRVIQEVLGAALIDVKPRELSKVLILLGGSNFGKSGVLEVLAGLFGPEQIATPLDKLDGTHGLMQFVRRVPWVLHEAFQSGKWLFSSTVKAIVTHEPVLINLKNGALLSATVRAPIFWATNHAPQFKEATRAITNRIIVLKCLRLFDPRAPLVGAAAEAHRRGFEKPSALILSEELPGLLNWAIEGLQQAAKRGWILLTDDMRETSEEIRRDSNPVAAFLADCTEYDPSRRLSVPDFCAAFAVWFTEQKGEDRFTPSNETIGRNLLAMSDPCIGINSRELRDMNRRYYAGIVLNEAGLAFWQRASESSLFEGKTASTTSPGRDPNSKIPDDWANRSSVLAMRKAQKAEKDEQDEYHEQAASKVVRDPDAVPSRFNPPFF